VRGVDHELRLRLVVHPAHRLPDSHSGLPVCPIYDRLHMGDMLNYIRGTTTTTGLTVKAFLDEGIYKKRQKVTNEDMDKLNLKYNSERPSWNYTISPSL
jgi:hypothetical protein